MKTFKNYSVSVLFLCLTMFSVFVSCSDKKGEDITNLSSVSKLESFSLDPALNAGADLEEVVTGVITNQNITVSVPYGASLTGLTATFSYSGASVKVGNVVQVSGVTKNDFSNPIVYSIIAENGAKKDYTVTVTKKLPRLPKVYVTTENGAPIVDKDTYLKTSVIVEDIDKVYSDGTKFNSTARIKGRGNSTWGMPKKPYRLNLDSKASLLGMSADKDWALLANYLDKTLLRNITAFEISRIAGMSWTPHSISVDFYLNGVYQGVYALTEHVKVSKDRLNMDLVKSSDNTGEALTGGYFLELDFHFDELYKFKTDIKELPIMFKDPDEPTTQQFNYVKNFFNTAESTLYADNFKDEQNGYRKYIDMESFINYYIIQELAKNVDGNLRGSCYLAIRRNGKIEQPLVWDFDLAFGNADYITWEQGASSAEYDGWFIKTCSPWYDRFFQDPTFVSALKKRWNELKPELDKIPAFIKERAQKLDEAQKRNFASKSSGGAGWDITKVEWNTNRIRGSYDAEVKYLTDFVEKRIAWLNTNINAL
ncbi:MAG: CotH kinase family protein [Niabella sp.]